MNRAKNSNVNQSEEEYDLITIKVITFVLVSWPLQIKLKSRVVQNLLLLKLDPNFFSMER